MKKVFMLFVLGIGLFLGTAVCYADNASEATLMDWASTIKLSTLTENKIYRYTAESATNFPSIVNDTGKNVILYLKERDGVYQQSILPSKTLKSQMYSDAVNPYQAGEVFNISFKTTTNEDILGRVDASKIIKLSAYSDGDSLSYHGAEFIYNDTSRDIVLTITDDLGAAGTKTETIPKNTIYGFDSSLSSVKVGATNETPGNNGGENNGGNNGGNTGNTGNTGNNDTGSNNNVNNEEEEEENPNTGVNISIIAIAGFVVLATLLFGVSTKKKAFNKI